MSRTIQVGEVVAGKYRVDRVLGEGGMGIVVAATHEQLEQTVALKFLLPSLAANAEVLQRFVREARAAVKIHSEHVARVLDVGTHEGMPFMVMEYLEGEDLAEVLARRGPLPVEETIGLVLQACEAIAEAHSLGIVHRDLKPANMFLARRPSGRPVVKVLDFGISKVASAAKDAVVTSTSAMMGSPTYMSPEQLVAAATVDARADVWSLGVVLYELLTRKVPFSAETMPELVALILTKTPERVTSHRDDIPVGVQAILERCLQREREQRYASVAELARALAPFGPSRSELSVERIEHLLGVAGQETVVAPARVPSSPQPPESRTFVPTTSQPTRGPDRRLLVIPVVAAVIGAAAVILVFRPSQRTAGNAGPPALVLAPSAAATVPVPVAASAHLVEPAPTDAATASSVASEPHPSSTLPAWATAKVPPRASASARPQASAAASAPAPAPSCHIASYFDADGNKHFKQECP